MNLSKSYLTTTGHVPPVVPPKTENNFSNFSNFHHLYFDFSLSAASLQLLNRGIIKLSQVNPSSNLQVAIASQLLNIYNHV